MRRMDRYNEIESEEAAEENINRMTRSNKNKDLYENIGKNTRYTNFTDVTNVNTYDISNVDRNNRTRENYQKMIEYSNFIPKPKVTRELDEFKSIYKEKENRVYDINSVIAEARKNRIENDEKESKRKLKNDKYNILLSMTKEELEEYRKERKERYMHPDEDELHELINTITTKTLAGEIDRNTSVNLLSELMATSIMDKVEKPEKEEDNLVDEIEEDLKTSPMPKIENDESNEQKEEKESINEQNSKEEIEEDDDFLDEKISKDQVRLLKEEIETKENEDTSEDEDFYSKSMDLSECDFEGEMDEDFKEKKLSLPLKIFFFLLVAVIVAATIYYVIQIL